MNAYEFEVKAMAEEVHFLQKEAEKAYDSEGEDQNEKTTRWRATSDRHAVAVGKLAKLQAMSGEEVAALNDAAEAALNDAAEAASRSLRTAGVKADLIKIMSLYNSRVNETMTNDKLRMHQILWGSHTPDYSTTQEEQVTTLALFLLGCFLQVSHPKLQAAADDAELNLREVMRKFW